MRYAKCVPKLHVHEREKYNDYEKMIIRNANTCTMTDLKIHVYNYNDLQYMANVFDLHFGNVPCSLCVVLFLVEGRLEKMYALGKSRVGTLNSYPCNSRISRVPGRPTFIYSKYLTKKRNVT